jgi:hypothetical protein
MQDHRTRSLFAVQVVNRNRPIRSLCLSDSRTIRPTWDVVSETRASASISGSSHHGQGYRGRRREAYRRLNPRRESDTISGKATNVFPLLSGARSLRAAGSGLTPVASTAARTVTAICAISHSFAFLRIAGAVLCSERAGRGRPPPARRRSARRLQSRLNVYAAQARSATRARSLSATECRPVPVIHRPCDCV